MFLVSIYIPTHNRSEMLKRAIESVLSQSYQSIEIIIIDDGSQDNTQSVLDYYKTKFDNIVTLKNERPKGACYSRNRAINIAKGKYITGLDDDDEFESYHIENLVNHYKDIYSFVAPSLKENDGLNTFARDNNVGLISLDLLLHGNTVGNQVLTQTMYLKEINGFDENLPALQDYDTWARLLIKYGDGLKLKETTYIWHTGHEKGRISNDNSKRILALNLFIDKYKANMTASHFKSMFILKKKIENTSFSFVNLILNINKLNYKSAVSLYINLNFPILGEKWRALKGALL